MKWIICSFLVVFWLSTASAQKGYVTKAIAQLGLPCAKEVGISNDDLGNLAEGDILSLKGGFGCYSDCIAQKLGMLADDGSFHLGKFKERIGKIVQPDVVKTITDSCSDKVGTEKCKISGSVLHCSLTMLVDAFYQ